MFISKPHINDIPILFQTCGKFFLTITMLKHHMKSVHCPEKKFICDHCSMSFAMKKFIACHMKRKVSSQKHVKSIWWKSGWSHCTLVFSRVWLFHFPQFQNFLKFIQDLFRKMEIFESNEFLKIINYFVFFCFSNISTNAKL